MAPLAAALLPSGVSSSNTMAILSQIMEGDAMLVNGSSDGARSRIGGLSRALHKMQSTTQEAARCCEALSKRSKNLDSLTSPASDASAMLSQTASNLGSVLIKMKDARDKFETVRDCEPAIEKLRDGVRSMEDQRKREADRKDGHHHRHPRRKHMELSEQDIYAAADSMEILRDAFDYFLERKHWRSAPNALQSLERVHKLGVSSMCTLVSSHLLSSGQALRLKRGGTSKKDGGGLVPPKNETAEQTRERLTKALQNRDLLKSIGEYEDAQPLEARPIREMRAVFECLGGEGSSLGPSRKKEPPSLSAMFGIPANRVNRTEKVGSGGYSNLVKRPLKTGFDHLNSYGDSRTDVAFKSIEGYYKRTKTDRKKNNEKRKSFDDEAQAGDSEADAAARDAVRCLEHAMVVVAGEKSVYRSVVAPSLVRNEEDEDAPKISPFYRKACVGAYSHVVSTVVDRTMDIIETVFLKEGGIGQAASAESSGSGLTVRTAASAAAAGLRMLDGVRMLGPSLAKLCDMPIDDPSSEKASPAKANAANMSIASTLCIAIHRTTVKNTAKTLENLAKAIQEDPVNGPKHRPPDARLASVSSDVVRAIRIISPFVSAYKSVTKRRALPWDPNIGEEAGEMDSYVRFLIMRLLNSLQSKALNYTKNEEDEGGFAKSNMFMINNTFYLLQHLAPENERKSDPGDLERFQLDETWFRDKVSAIFNSEKRKYLAHWENINTHLTSVDSNGLEYQKNKNLLSLDSGRQFKERFKGFQDEFDRMYTIHNKLSVVDPGLRKELQIEVKGVFLKRYEKFYDKYSTIRFSKKNQQEYLRLTPQKVDAMLNVMYGGNFVVGEDSDSD